MFLDYGHEAEVKDYTLGQTAVTSGGFSWKQVSPVQLSLLGGQLRVACFIS